ncbi:MAG: polyprenyl diphosphate synthase [Dehalococcoidia bacterium]
MVVEKTLASLPRIERLPEHVAVIMDGNGRWAEGRGLSRNDGHRAGAENVRTVIERVAEHGVPMLTLFAFSTENWGRPAAEVDALMQLGSDFIDGHLDDLDEHGVRVRHIGDPSRLPAALRDRVERAAEQTAANDRITVNIAFNYGGRADVVQAVRRLVSEGVAADEVTEEAIAGRLWTAGVPDPDLLVRTGAVRRISNFLLWQAAYAEYYFFDGMWPDFDASEVDRALLDYSKRQRRFGRVPDGADAAT